MQRYFIEEENKQGNTVTISGQDFHHIKNVMRCVKGDKVIITLPSGESYEATIASFSNDSVNLDITKELNEKNKTMNLSIAQSLIKKDHFELVLQKTTELGVKELFPIMTQRSIIKLDNLSKKMPRYQTIVKEASEQSERTQLPKIHELSTIKTLPYELFDVVLIAYARETDNQLRSVISEIGKHNKVLVLIGPEGGFSDTELEYLDTVGTFVSLGDTILRSETAAIYVASAFRYLWGV